ncbi:MAG: hypothetical protein IKN38_05440 [Clostridia bacterium]|nr:hypothetical protein [Clostridia bacterium]
MSSLLHSNFDSEYDIMLSSWGEGVLDEEGLLDIMKPESIFKDYGEDHKRPPKSISLFIDDPGESGLGYSCTGVDTAFLEKLEKLKELILPDSIKHIGVTPKLNEIFKKNDTLIRGNFDSYAEKFAKENSLRFRPSDYVFARYYFEPAREQTTMILTFKRNGKVEIKEDITSPGTSSSNTLGGTFIHPLKKDFYMKMSAQEIAGKFRGAIRDAIINEGKLSEFIEKAKSHGYFTGNNK